MGMVRNRVAVLPILALVSVGVTVSHPAADAVQIVQNQTVLDARRAAEEAEYAAERARDDDRQEILDAQEQARTDALLKTEESEREGGAEDANRRRVDRKTRLKALIDR